MLNSNYKRTMEKVLFAFFFCFNRYIFLCHTRFGDVHTHTWTLSHENETRITEIKQKQTNVAFKRVVFFFCFVLVLLISFTFLFFFTRGASWVTHIEIISLSLCLLSERVCVCIRVECVFALYLFLCGVCVRMCVDFIWIELTRSFWMGDICIYERSERRQTCFMSGLFASKNDTRTDFSTCSIKHFGVWLLRLLLLSPHTVLYSLCSLRPYVIPTL